MDICACEKKKKCKKKKKNTKQKNQMPDQSFHIFKPKCSKES